MSRKKREVEKVFKVFCEGDTENNYFDYIRKHKKISLAIKPVNMHGGGYSNFLSQIKEDANSNCLAKFIVIDGDRAVSIQGEKANLKKIIEYCKVQNESKRIPHILIIDFPDFEYVACLHIFNYKGQNVEQFIKTELKYSDIEKFKSDQDVFSVLVERGKGSIDHLLGSINAHTALIQNDITVNKNKYEIQVCTTVNEDNWGKRGTNFDDFYKLLVSVGVVVNT